MKIKDNNAKASINFQKANMKVAAFHNAREAFTPKSSHAELAEKNECSCSALAAIKKIQKWDEKADQNYAKNHGGRRSPIKETSKVWEAVVNLRENHTMADVKKLVKKLEEKTGYKAAQIAIHRDEGHVSDDGDFIQNIHAHILFYARDPKTGLSLSTKHYGQTEFFEEIQDLVADELKMERGRSARETGAKHENMHSYKARKQAERAERTQNKEWEAKMAEKQAEWQAKMAEKQAEWEAKLAEREAKREEWERRMPEIMAARRRNEQFLNGRVDWETLKTANRAFLAWHDISTDILGYPNPNGNLLVEQTKGALASIFRLFGSVSQLAIFLLTRTEARELKLQNTLNVYKVSENLQRAINLVKNDTTNDHVKIVEKIQNVYNNLPVDKRAELIELAILHAPNDEIREDLRALVEGRFEDIAKSEQAQRRIENRDLKAALKEYAAEAKRIKDELKEMDEENRILNLAERALLKDRGANREQYAEQESANRERLNELSELKQQAKDLNNAIREQKQSPDKDAKTIAEQAEKIAELTAQIAQITAENAKKQKELEEELKQEKAKRLITPQQLDRAEQRISELEDKIKEQEFIFYGKIGENEIEAAEFEKEIIAPQTLDIFDIIDEQKPEKIEPEPKIEKPEPIREPEKIEPLKRSDGSEQSEAKPNQPEPEPIKKADFTNIYGYDTPKPEPRKREIDDRPKYYEPEPVKIEPEEPREEPIFRDPWQKITDEIEKWKKCESEVEKKMLSPQILRDIEKYEKSGWDIPLHRQLTLDSFRRAASYDPAEAINRERERKLEEQKRQAAELELEKKYDDVKKNVKQDTDAKQTALKKKKKDELEMGMS